MGGQALPQGLEFAEEAAGFGAVKQGLGQGALVGTDLAVEVGAEQFSLFVAEVHVVVRLGAAWGGTVPPTHC
ncbi:MAG: hypothetical protein BroJett014_29700 [Planctomycetota bacterium]|nr:MAG: hypothetical protein BroJett014_29700 [Planctomycetota bacterium]